MTSLNDLGLRHATFRGGFRDMLKPALMATLILGAAAIFRLWKLGDMQELAGILIVVVPIWAALIVILYGAVKWQATHIHEGGLAGRTFLGRGIELKWSDIECWRVDETSGVSAVVISENHSDREMWVLYDVFFSDRFQEALRPFPEIPRAAEPDS